MEGAKECVDQPLDFSFKAKTPEKCDDSTSNCDGSDHRSDHSDEETPLELTSVKSEKNSGYRWKKKNHIKTEPASVDPPSLTSLKLHQALAHFPRGNPSLLTTPSPSPPEATSSNLSTSSMSSNDSSSSRDPSVILNQILSQSFSNAMFGNAAAAVAAAQSALQSKLVKRSSAASSSTPSPSVTRKRGRPLPDDLKDEAYWERRRKNNEAAKRSRDARRNKESELAFRATVLETENMQLRCEVTQLKGELAKLRCLMYSN